MQQPVFQPSHAIHMQTNSLYRNCYPRTPMLNYKLIMKSKCSSQWYSLKYWIDSIRNTTPKRRHKHIRAIQCIKRVIQLCKA